MLLPPLLSLFNILLLSVLCACRQQDHNFLAFDRKVNPVARSEVHPKFADSLTHTFRIAEVASADSGDPSTYSVSGGGIPNAQIPLLKRATTTGQIQHLDVVF